MKLEPQNQISITREAIASILSAYSILDFSFEPINEGIANVSIIIKTEKKKYVLRIYAQNKKSDEDIALEIKFQDYLRAHGIPIPAIYPNKKGNELNIAEIGGKRWQTILMEFVEGKSVTTGSSPRLIANLASLQAKMHLLGIAFVRDVGALRNSLTELRDSLAKKIEIIPAADSEVSDLVERIRAYHYSLSPELPCGYNHLDIDFDGNVLTKDDRVSAIVDFDDLQYSPAIVCLGYSIWSIFDDEGLEAARLYLQEYEKLRPLIPLEREALPHILFFRNYVIGIIRLLLWNENTPIDDIKDILRFEKEIPTIKW